MDNKKINQENDPYLTDPELLEQALHEDCNEAAWRRFEDTYRKLIYAVAADFNVLPVDRDDVINEIFAELKKQGSNFRYSPEKGRFRNYLQQVVRHHVLRRRKKDIPNKTSIDENPWDSPDDDGFAKIWDKQYEQFIIGRALKLLGKRVDPKSYEIFYAVALKGEKPVDVASEFGVTRDTVDSIKFKCTRMLQTYRSLIENEEVEI